VNAQAYATAKKVTISCHLGPFCCVVLGCVAFSNFALSYGASISLSYVLEVLPLAPAFLCRPPIRGSRLRKVTKFVRVKH
jgi:hypothetical protein